MNTYEFTVMLAGVDLSTENLEDQMVEASCDDALLCFASLAKPHIWSLYGMQIMQKQQSVLRWLIWQKRSFMQHPFKKQAM